MIAEAAKKTKGGAAFTLTYGKIRYWYLILGVCLVCSTGKNDIVRAVAGRAPSDVLSGLEVYLDGAPVIGIPQGLRPQGLNQGASHEMGAFETPRTLNSTDPKRLDALGQVCSEAAPAYKVLASQTDSFFDLFAADRAVEPQFAALHFLQ